MISPQLCMLEFDIFGASELRLYVQQYQLAVSYWQVLLVGLVAI